MKNTDSIASSSCTRRGLLKNIALPASGGIILAEVARAMQPPASQANHTTASDDLGARVYNIRAFGAKGDKATNDSKALQAAIDTCTRDGGGTVLVPAGTFKIGSVEIKSNVTIHIAAGGTLLGSGMGTDYHAVDAIPLHGDTTLNDGNWALLFAANARNFSIEGPGTIDGQGAQFHSTVRGTPPPSGLGGNKRPYHVLIYKSENFSIRNLSLIDCAYHSIRIIESQRIVLDSIYIHNRVNGNNDGFHFISAEQVRLSNCTVKAGDDACAMFGSCKYISITNSYFSTRWSVFRFGGGTAGNIAISNCVLHEVYGCPIKFQGDPGSHFENIAFSDLVMSDVTGPISISIGGRLPAPDDKVPVTVRNISFSHFHGTITTNPPTQLSEGTLTIGTRPGEGHSAIVLNSVNNSLLENISFDDIHLVFGGGGTLEEGARRDVPEIFGEYFRLGPIPAYGLYARNAKGITFHNVRLETSTPDLRPAIILDHVNDAAFYALAVQGNTGAESVLRFVDSTQVLVASPRVLTDSPAFLQAEGDACKGIIVEGGDISRSATPVAFKSGAGTDSVKLRNI